MSGKMDIFIGVVDKPAATGGAATSLVDQFNSNKNGFQLINQNAQTAATVTGVISVTAMTNGFVPFLNVTTNTFAATTTFLKVTADFKEGKPIQPGDVLSLVGNVVGIAASITIMATAVGTAGLLLTGIAVTVNVLGMINSDAVKNLYKATVQPLWNRYFKDNPAASYPDYWVAPDLKLATLAEIQSVYANKIAANHWDPRTNQVGLGSTLVEPQGPGASGPGNIGGWGGSGGGPPLINPSAVYPFGRVVIPNIFVVDPNQDGYGCCRGNQDAYY
ncbi:hypothetical protein ACIOVF_04075 [Pseudomonas sp. NPDC087612]|uniref:hypothetical protein n=1 Tax=unclassified Pseudomonas TaxID=196821 RepID=UPI000A9C27E4|nr:MULTISPECIES: hypothetical protein [unclassified Pseudomonas]UVL62842.1 hypothetical protein LOY54_06100 [Pseudomonas sp. B21-032]